MTYLTTFFTALSAYIGTFFASIASDFFSELGNIMSSVGSFFTSLWTALVGMIYTAGEGTSGGSFTVFGVIVLIGVAFAIFMWGFKFILKLLHLKG